MNKLVFTTTLLYTQMRVRMHLLPGTHSKARRTGSGKMRERSDVSKMWKCNFSVKQTTGNCYSYVIFAYVWSLFRFRLGFTYFAFIFAHFRLRAKLSVVAAVILKMSNLRIIICLGGKHAGGMSQGDRVTKLPKNICECDIWLNRIKYANRKWIKYQTKTSPYKSLFPLNEAKAADAHWSFAS